MGTYVRTYGPRPIHCVMKTGGCDPKRRGGRAMGGGGYRWGFGTLSVWGGRDGANVTQHISS